MTGLQPLLAASTVVLSAPAQAWSAPDGDIGGSGISGFYVGDRRVLSTLSVTANGASPEHIRTATPTASTAVFVALLRGVDDATADPKVRLQRRRTLTPQGLREELTVESTLTEVVRVTLEARIRADFASMDQVKAGLAGDLPGVTPEVRGDVATWDGDAVGAELTAAGATLSLGGADLVASWEVEVAAKSSATVSLEITARIADAVVGPPAFPSGWDRVRVRAADIRLQRWVAQALTDLEALRMSVPTIDDAVFLAAGAPWFFTLFGRDSIWAARMLLPLGTDLAGDTLRVLASMQGREIVPDTAEQPGKIMHELRAAALEIPGEGVVLPPLYYGTVDATALWINLLHDAWKWGLPEDQVQELLPTLEAALAWIRDYGDSDGDGFLEYVDESGRGLANQGWKDSGDSVQWNDGRLATGPIALCEVQGYAYEAMRGGADLLEHFGRDGAEEWRARAEDLKAAFATKFWVDGDGGAYPAIALDADKRPVDSLTSNIGHLLGTGILSEEEARLVAHHLASERMSSGFGLRTMSTGAAGYWPLSYHGGSVWAHDTAIAILGLRREGFTAEAAQLSEGLLAAAEGFDYRMPELHSGDASTEIPRPVPYPAACRPQAWSAASAIAVLHATLGLEADRETGGLTADPAGTRLAAGVRVEGVTVGRMRFTVRTSPTEARITPAPAD